MTWADLSRIHGLSIATVALALAGNALMVPRALFTRDVIWLTGTLWGSLVMGWMQLVTFAVAGQLPGGCLAAITGLMAGYYAWVLAGDMRAKGLTGLSAVLQDMLRGGTKPLNGRAKPG